MSNTHAATGLSQTAQGNNQQILDAINTIGLSYGFDPEQPENTVIKNQNDLEIKVEEFKSEHVNTVKELKEALHGAITSTAGNHITTVTELKDTINSAIVNSADNHTNTIADLKDSLKTVISEQSSTHTSTVTDLKDTINNTLSISNTNNTALLTNLTSTIEQAIVQSLTGISNAFSEKFGELANSISNRDASANNRIENLISSLAQDSNSSSDSLNNFAESIIKRDSSANERIENLITTLTVIDNCGNQELNNLAKTIISKDSSANDRLENLTKQLLQNDISGNNRLQELVTTLTNIDISFNNRLFELTQTIVNRDLSANQRFETLINKINDTDSSQNQRIINLISTINNNDISRNDHLSNLIIQIKHNDASFNENTRKIITSIQNSDISSSAITNKLINTFISRDASNTESLVSTLSNINTRADHRNGLLIDKISNFDISLNKNLENIIENIAISDSCSNYIFQTMTQQLINSDSSANERIHKLCTSIHNFDISFSEAINDTLIAIDNSRNETLQTIKHMDNSTNQHIVNLISSIDQSNNVIIEKMQDILCSIHQSHDESMDNISDVMNNLNIKSNETQQKLQEYIGRYIVIPLFKQRIIDTSVTYYKMLEKRILCVIEDYLVYFKKGDFASLVVYYNTKKQIELATEVYDIKKEAFEKFLTFTPGATCFSDMDEDTVEQYKSFRKYISWAYKTLDGLIKAIDMWSKIVSFNVYDSEILNNDELLAEYITAKIDEESRSMRFLEDQTLTLNINPGALNIKPKYEEYRKRYGWPEDGIFDAEKMAGIIKDLEAQGIIEPPKPDICSSSGLSSNENTENTECTSNTETGETSNTETGETTNTEQETTENDSATSSAETQESSAETQESSAETQESSAETQESSDCGEKSSSEKSSSEKSSSDSNNNSANTDSESCKSKSDSSNKSSDTDVNSIVKSLSSCSTTSDVNSCSFSEDDLCENELTKYTTAAYFVYVAIEDPMHYIETFYYPLFLSKNDAIDANDVSSNNDAMSWTFAQHPGIIFWMPYSDKSNWGPTSTIHPPLALEYIHFTNSVGSSGIYYHPISRNKRPRDAFSFEVNNTSYFKYMMMSPVANYEQVDPVGISDVVVRIPWFSLPDDENYNWHKLFSFTTNATNLNEIYSNSFSIKYNSYENQWFNKNILTLENVHIDDSLYSINSDKNTNIAIDFIKHIANELFGYAYLYVLLNNYNEIYFDISNNSLYQDTINKIRISDLSGQNGLNDVKVMPSTILSVLSKNSQFGHKRIEKLLDERNNDLSKEMFLLKNGDNITFNVTIEPSNNGIIEGTTKRLTPKTYKIVLVLLDNEEITDYTINPILSNFSLSGILYPSNTLLAHSNKIQDSVITQNITYQWKRNGNTISNSNYYSYVLTDIDSGNYISCTITLNNSDNTTSSINTGNYIINENVLPEIRGPLRNGTRAIAYTYYLRGNLTFKWYRNDVLIKNSTDDFYDLSYNDIGNSIVVLVETDISGISPLTSLPSPIITDILNDEINSKININGIFYPSNTITAIITENIDYFSSETISYQWIIDNSNILGETNNTYNIISKDIGKNISCKITYQDSLGNTNILESNKYLINSFEQPSINGIFEVGNILNCSINNLNGTLSYIWKRNNITIIESSLNVYRLTDDDLDKTISVTVVTDISNINPITSLQTNIIEPTNRPIETSDFSAIFSENNKLVFTWKTFGSNTQIYIIEKNTTIIVGDANATSGFSSNRINETLHQTITVPSNTKLNEHIEITNLVIDDTAHMGTPPAETNSAYIFPIDKSTWTENLIKFIAIVLEYSEGIYYYKMLELILEKTSNTIATFRVNSKRYNLNASTEIISLIPNNNSQNIDGTNRTSFSEWSDSALQTLTNAWTNGLVAYTDYALESITLKIYEEIITTNQSTYLYNISDNIFNFTIKTKNNNLLTNRSNELILLSTTEKLLIDTWLSNNTDTLNRFGDSIDTVYTGGNPLFNEENELITDLYDYIKTQNPTNPWI